jgi:hypothetical protein
MPLDPSAWGVVGGDDEPPLLLKTLALAHPEVEWVIIGRNSGEKPMDVGLPSNVTNPWVDILPNLKADLRQAKSTLEKIAIYDQYTLDLFRNVDELVIWTGQHGTSNSPIPKVGAGWDDVTQPQEAFVNYASYAVRGINAFRQIDPLSREEIWLCPDPRNYLKCRDLKWPPLHPVLGQFDFTRTDKHERYTDTRSPEECGFSDAVTKVDGNVWTAHHEYIYSQLEICGILPEHVNAEFSGDFYGRRQFGLFINEARSYVKHNRLDALTQFVLPLQPDFIHGKWTPASQETITTLGGPVIQPAPAEAYYDLLRSVKCTFTTPSSGSGWATTKPWQSFATGTICFFHPEYDTQGHIIPTKDQVEAWESSVGIDDERIHLAKWLRVDSPDELRKKVDAVSSSPDTWAWLATTQRRLYDKACNERRIIKLIEERLRL